VNIPSKISAYRSVLSSPLFSNSLFILGNQVMLAAVGFAFWLVAARFYDAEQVGIASASTSAMILISYFGLLGLDYALMRFLAGAGDRSNSIINTTLALGSLASLVLAIGFAAGVNIWSPSLAFLRTNPLSFVAFVLCTALWTSYWLNARVFIGKRRASLAFGQGVAFNVLRLGLLVALAPLHVHTGIFLAWGIAGAVAFLIGIAFLTRRAEPGYRFSPTIEWRLVWSMVRFALANHLISLAWFGAIYVMPLIVAYQLGATQNAYFFIAWQLTNILYALPIAVSFALTVEGSHDEGAMRRSARRGLVLCLAAVIAGVSATLLLAPWVLSFFGGQYADNAASVLRWSSLSALPIAFNQMYFAVKRVQLRMKSTMVLNAVASLTSLILSYILVGRMGISGAGIAWLFAHGLVAIATAILWFREDGICGLLGRHDGSRSVSDAPTSL
jgi:O-antigen/teichoic acid export membrane protein